MVALRFGLLFWALSLLLLVACSQAPSTSAPESQPLLDDRVMLRMALHYGWSPRPYIEMTGAPTEVRATEVITYEEAVKFRGGQLHPDTSNYQRKEELVRLYVFRGDITGLHYEIPEEEGPFTLVSTKIAQIIEIVNASTGQGMGSSGRNFGAELDVSTLKVVEIPDNIYSIAPVTMVPGPPVTAAPPATSAPKPPEETPTATAAPTRTPSPRTKPTGCSGREQEPPCGPGVEIGKSYSYTLYTHCGVRRANLDGRQWIADPLLIVNKVNPPPVWANPFDTGAIILVTDDLARFTSDAGLMAEFRPLPKGAEYPWKPCL